jgi:Flp pilus assembly protein TadB
MSVISTSENKQPTQADDGRPQAAEAAMHHVGCHSMNWMMLLCVFGVIAGVVGWGGWGINIAGLFCVVMMIGMVWMMATPAAAKVRHHALQRTSSSTADVAAHGRDERR